MFLAFIAAAESAAPEWITYLLNGGPFAIVVLLIILDKLTPTGERDRLRLENLALREEIKELNEQVRKEIVPPLVQVNSLMKEVIDDISYQKRAAKYRGDV